MHKILLRFRSQIFIVLAATLIVLPQLPAQQPETLTNQAVVDLVQNGISADVIVQIVQQQPETFVLNSKSVIKLKQQGVPQKVIAAMLARGNSTSAGSAVSTKAAPPVSQSTRPNFTWELQQRDDKMTGKNETLTVLTTPAVTASGDHIGSFETIANCSRRDVSLRVAFLADAKPGFGYKQNTTSYYVNGGLFGALQAASNHKKAWTETRVRLDDAQPVTVISEDDYLNSSTILFAAPVDKNDQSGAAAFVAFAGMITPNKPAGYSDAFFSANRVLLEMTMEHGEQAIVEIHPQDSSFKGFAGQCSGVARSPAPQIVSSPGDSPTRNQATVATPATVFHAAANPGVPATQRYIVVAGSTFQVELLEPITVDAARSSRTICGRLSQALQAPSLPGLSGAASTTPRSVVIPAGTEVVIQARMSYYNAKVLAVQLESRFVRYKGVTVPLTASSQLIKVAPNVFDLINRKPSHVSSPSADTLLMSTSDRAIMTVSLTATVPSTYQP